MANHASFAHDVYHGSIGRVSRRSGVIAALIVLVLFSIGFYLFNPAINPIGVIGLALIVWFALGALTTFFVGECIASGAAGSRERYQADERR